MKIAVVTPIPTPYRDPFWNEVARQPGVELHVFYCAAGKADRPWEVNWSRSYAAEVLRGWNMNRWRGADASCFWNPGITERLREGHFDAVVIGGYNHPTMWAAMRYAVQTGIPYFLMCETYRRRSPGAISRITRQLVGWAVSHATGGFPTGVLAERYLSHYGAATGTLTKVPNVPDVSKLARESRELRSRRKELRDAHGLSGGPVVLFCGRLIPKKRAELLIRAFSRARAGTNAELIIVGDGPERERLENLARSLGLEGYVRFAGFVQPAEVQTWYAMADLFVLPSSETWGVVVLEALASGLPVIVTDEVGCHPDVVVDPDSGDVIPAGDESALTCSLTRSLSILPEGAKRTGELLGEDFHYTRIAERLVLAIEEALTREVPEHEAKRRLVACR